MLLKRKGTKIIQIAATQVFSASTPPGGFPDRPRSNDPLRAFTVKKCLICELWWMGDATLMTPILQGLLADGWDVTVLGKTQSRRLLEDNYPAVHWIEFDAPWTVFHGKYRLWRWPWGQLLRVLRDVHRQHFDAAVSIRRDPRDHLLFWAAQVPRRIGFRAPYSWHFLNEVIPVLPLTDHRVEDWWGVQRRLSPTATTFFPPHLAADSGETERFRTIFFTRWASRSRAALRRAQCSASVAEALYARPYRAVAPKIRFSARAFARQRWGW